jgi:hypothetical protein
MTEQPTSSKNSETDPPAANQPVGDDDAAEPTASDTDPAEAVAAVQAPEIVPGKPDGEVDTRA